MASQRNLAIVQLGGATGGAIAMALGTSRLGWEPDRVASGLAVVGSMLAMQSQGWLQQLALGVASAGLSQALQRHILRIAGHISPEEPRQAAPDGISREEVQQSLAQLAQQYEQREHQLREQATAQIRQLIAQHQELQQQMQAAAAAPEPEPEIEAEPPAPPPPRRQARPASRDVFDRQQEVIALLEPWESERFVDHWSSMSPAGQERSELFLLSHTPEETVKYLRERILRPQDAPAHANGVARKNGVTHHDGA